jgi:hypothetical protein
MSYKVDRRNFLKTIGGSAVYAIIPLRSFAAFDAGNDYKGQIELSGKFLTEPGGGKEFAGIEVSQIIRPAEKVTLWMQEQYNKINQLYNLQGRTFDPYAAKGNFDTISAGFADELEAWGTGDRHTSAIDVFQLKQYFSLGGTDELTVPVVGFDKDKKFELVKSLFGEFLLKPTNNPLDYDVAGRRGETIEKVLYGNKEHALHYLGKGVEFRKRYGKDKKGRFGSVNDSHYIIVVKSSEKQKNNPLTVHEIIEPDRMEGERICTVRKIIPVEYDLGAKKITPEMCTELK